MRCGQAFLDYATADAGRLIRIGQVQQGQVAKPLSTSQLCADVHPLISCGSLQFNVQSASNPGFGSLSATVAADSYGNLATTSLPGGRGDGRAGAGRLTSAACCFTWISSTAMSLCSRPPLSRTKSTAGHGNLKRIFLRPLARDRRGIAALEMAAIFPFMMRCSSAASRSPNWCASHGPRRRLDAGVRLRGARGRARRQPIPTPKSPTPAPAAS